jgi:hypothetical protein
MLMESLVLAVDDREVKQVVASVASSPELVVRGLRFEQGVVVVDTTVRAPVPIHPSFRVEVVAARGASLTVRVSGPMGLGTGPLDVLINRISSRLPQGVSYLGRGVITIDLVQASRGALKSLNMAGIAIQPGQAVVRISSADVDLSALAQAASTPSARPGATGDGASGRAF